MAIELDNGRRHQVWGVGLEMATVGGNAKLGDHVRRGGIELVTKEINLIDAANGTDANRTSASARNPGN